MPFWKKKDKWKRMLIGGTGTVICDANGAVVNASKPSSATGAKKLTFKANGDCRKSEDGNWLKQVMTFSIWDTNPLAVIVANLKENDYVDVFGVLDKTPYVSPTTGKTRSYLEVKLSKIQLLYHGDGTLPIEEDLTATSVQDDDDEDIPF
jgi:hypothetical protein